MEWLPKDYEGSWTLINSVTRKGVGLHSGNTSQVTLSPSEKQGFHISFKNSRNSPIKLTSNQIIHSELCTTLDLGEKKLVTVEHLLAALAGSGLTHVHIEVEGEEVPLLDGSSIEWVYAIQEAGIQRACTPKKEIPIIYQPIVLNKGSSVITATPFEGLKIIGIIDFSYPAIGQQMFSIDLNPVTFVADIAPARTFGFKDQIDSLISKGLIKGGGLNNALVCSGESWLNPPLRFKDEPVRHKILDLIGDLALVGLPRAQVLVYRGSHSLHAQLASALSK